MKEIEELQMKIRDAEANDALFSEIDMEIYNEEETRI
jgi:hypothetical protein